MVGNRLFLVLAACWIAAACAPRPEDPVVKALLLYYGGGDPPPWQAAVEALAYPVPENRVEAGRWLTALMKRALADERWEATRSHSTPFSRGSDKNPARELRGQIARALADAKSLPAEAMPLVVYLLREERLLAFQGDGVKALGRLAGEEADALRLALVSEPHANAEVVVGALEQLVRGGKTVPPAVTDALGRHPRAVVRAAARAIRPSPAFDPVAAIASPPVARLLDDIGRLLIDAPAPDIAFVRMTRVWYESTGLKEEDRDFVDGWVQKHEGDRYTLLSTYGWTRDFTVRAVPPADTSDGPRTTTTIEPWRIDDEVALIVDEVSKGDREKVAERGALVAQREDGPSTPEILVGWWAQRAGRPDLAAKLLLPALDTVVADEDLIDILRQRLGQIYGYKLIVAFVGERDYAEAIRIANIIVTRFPDAALRGTAVRLAAELPRRAEDFRTFKLPTPSEWARLRPTLSRAQQIDYLVARLRLLNCFQFGQPGGVEYFMVQTAEPMGLEPNAAVCEQRGKTPVINPATELMGNREHWIPPRRTEGMALTVADIPQLALGLREDWKMLAVSYWRRAHFARSVHDTSDLLTWLINDLAKEELIDRRNWDTLDADARKKEIARITAWAKARRGRSEADQIVTALEYDLKASPRWSDVSSQASRLVELKDARAVPLLLRYLKAKPGAYDLLVLSLGRDFRPEAFRDAAAEHLGDPDVRVRAEAALIRLKTGDKEGGRRALAGLIAVADDARLGAERLKAVVEGLLADGAPESRAIAQSLFTAAQDERRTDNVFLTVDLAHLYARHGLADPLRYFRRMLDRSGNRFGPATILNGRSVAEAYADEITTMLAPKDPEIIRITAAYANSADRLSALRKWLDAKIADPASLGGGPSP